MEDLLEGQEPGQPTQPHEQAAARAVVPSSRGPRPAFSSPPTR